MWMKNKHFWFHKPSASLYLIIAGIHAASAFASGSTIQTVQAPTSTSVFFATPPASLNVPADFTAGVFFSTDFLKDFFSGFEPTQTSVEPQPKITDPVGHTVFPIDLTNPDTIPTANLEDPVVFPPSLLTNSGIVVPPTANLSTPGSIALRNQVFEQIIQILENTSGAFTSSCGQCIAGLSAIKQLALAAPWEVPPLLIQICNLASGSLEGMGSCEQEFSANSNGDIAAQVLANSDITGLDGQYMCSQSFNPLGKTCPQPPPTDLTELLTTWFAKPKPANAVSPPPSGKKAIRVVHLSDFHIDPRYTIGTEANCDQSLCCRPGTFTTQVPPGQLLLPAPRFGALLCDTPWLLANAVMHAIGPLTGVNPENSTVSERPVSFTIFTGDLVSHDGDNQLSRSYVEYAESATFELFKEYLGGGPVYAALGNHDTWPQAFDAPHSLQPEQLANQFEWAYAHLADLWEAEGWISSQVAAVSRATYAAYSTITPFGLKVITLNTDFWYNSNLFNYINMSNPDNSGMLRFLTDELQAAEDAGQRVWILGHVLPGWDGTAALPNPSNLFYQIVDRFSPHVIANIFMGHIHDEVRYIYYANNATVMNANTALTTTWVGPSVTPLTGLNSGFSMYEVDPVTFDVMEAYTWFSNVSTFAEVDQQGAFGASYHFEYSTRETFGVGFDWPSTAPLNATWWHLVTESMEQNSSLVEIFTLNQGRHSVLTQNCTSAICQEAKICYLRSGSAPVAGPCPPGFGAV